MKICPRCRCREFLVTWHVAQTERVDSDGDFIEEVTSCDEVLHKADDDDIWTCAGCEYDAPGSEFEAGTGQAP